MEGAEALEEAHAKRILHRDVTPNNVLIGRDGRARLTDFGLAHLYVPPGEESRVSTRAPALTLPGRAMGTPGYMSPEQVQGKDSDHRSDLFSLGVILYEMITNRNPFKGLRLRSIISLMVVRDSRVTSSARVNLTRSFG